MRLNFHRRLQALAALGALPALLLAASAMWGLPWPWWFRLPALLGAAACALEALRLLGTQAQRPLQTLSNLLGALKEGDFSFRAREPRGDDALGEVYLEVNALSELLQQQRIRALEATALLSTVMGEIDVAVFAFDEGGALRLVNRAGEALLHTPRERLLGMGADGLGLCEALEGTEARLMDLAFPGRSGRFEVRHSLFRQGGRPHHLLVLSDLTHALREEERQAWHRLVRVLGHEINNSLAPIQSLSASLSRILEARGEDWEGDLRQGLGIIASRSLGLGRFMEGYTRLARLPEPRLGTVEVGPLVRRVAGLEQRLAVAVIPGPEVEIRADGDQLAQALINLVRNAVDASRETGGSVSVSWSVEDRALEFRVEDEGQGLPAGGNLFVPFFTTKPTGSGIGLVLARRVAEAHGGSLSLTSRTPKGARAVLRLPLAPDAFSPGEV